MDSAILSGPSADASRRPSQPAAMCATPPSFDAMLALGNTAFIVLNASSAGTILYVSPSVVPTLGISGAALLGRTLDGLSGELLHPEDMAAVRAAAQRACDAPADAPPEGARARVRISAHCPWRETELKFSRDGEYLYATARDASEECRVESLLRAFLATASHDLRTPVGAMLSAAALLAECPRVAEDDEASTLLASLRASCEMMLGTVNNVSDVRLPGVDPDAGAGDKLHAKGERIQAAATLTDVLNIASTAFGRPCAWINEAEALSGPLAIAVLLGDAAALRQTMLNLAVACDRLASHDASCTAELQLRLLDCHAADLEVIFRASGPTNADLGSAFDLLAFDGVGLALYAARRQARTAGGDVVAASLPCGILLQATLRFAVASVAGTTASMEAADDAQVEAGTALHLAALTVGIKAAPVEPPGPCTQQLALTTRMLEHLVRTSDDLYHVGTIGPGFDFNFAFASPAVYSLFGFAPEDLVGTCPMAWTHPDDVPRCKSIFVGALGSLGGEGDSGPSHAVVSVPRRFRHRDGGYTPVISMGVVTRDRWCLACKDVSSQFGRDEAQRRLLLLLSRQLREPANAVLAAYELLQLRLDSTAATEGDDTALLLGSIGASCRILLGLIGNVLCAQAVQAGVLTPRDIDVPFDPAAVLADVLRVCRLAYASVVWDVDAAALPPFVRGVDRALVCQILSNLAVNACKFEAGGGVSVHANMTAESDLLVVVTDRGRGLSPIDAERLFEPFTSAAPVAQGGGAGLGLYVSQTAARLMGGDLELTSTALGRGTTFTLRLPVHVVPANTAAGANDAAAHIPAAKPLLSPPSPLPSPAAAAPPTVTLRCLLVDDHPLNLSVMSRLLLRAGFATVETAADGYDALAALYASFAAGTPPDAVLMDMQMPKMTGPESAAAFRAWEASTVSGKGAAGMRLPIVCVTANVLHRDHDECLAAGMDDVVVKPLQRRDVEALVGRAMQYSKCRVAAAEAAEMTTATKIM